MVETLIVVIAWALVAALAVAVCELALIGLAVLVSIRWAVRNGIDAGDDDDFADRLAGHGGAP